MVNIFRISSSSAQKYSLGAKKKSHSSQDEWDSLSFSAVLTTASRAQLSVAFGQTERSSSAANTFGLSCFRSTAKLDRTKLLLVVHYIFLKREKKTLSAFGRENLAVVHTSLGQTWKSSHEVDDKFLVAVVDDRQVAVVAVGYFGSQLDLELLRSLFLCHDVVKLFE